MQPHALGAARIGVGACVWEGEMLLAAYLASLPRHRFVGEQTPVHSVTHMQPQSLRSIFLRLCALSVHHPPWMWMCVCVCVCVGARAIELGAGPGLAGMVLARMGAEVRTYTTPYEATFAMVQVH